MKKARRSFSHGSKDSLREINTLKRDYSQNLRWQITNLFVTYQATLWRRIALLFGLIAVAAVAGMALMYFRFTPVRPLVTIGNHVVQRREYLEKLDEAAGRPVLTKIVYAELVRQAAVKAGAMPTDAEVDERIAQMKRHGQAVPTGTALTDFQESLTLDMAMENLRIAGVNVSDSELQKIYSQNTAQLTEPAQVQSILVVTNSAFGAQIATTALLKGKTAPEIAALPDMHVDGENGYHINLGALPPVQHEKAVKTALGMQPGQIATLPFGNAFLIIKCLHKTPPHLPAFPEIKDELARAVKLQRGPSASAEMVKLYRANKPVFDMDRYSKYFLDIEQAEDAPTASAPKTASVP